MSEQYYFCSIWNKLTTWRRHKSFHLNLFAICSRFWYNMFLLEQLFPILFGTPHFHITFALNMQGPPNMAFCAETRLDCHKANKKPITAKLWREPTNGKRGSPDRRPMSWCGKQTISYRDLQTIWTIIIVDQAFWESLFTNHPCSSLLHWFGQRLIVVWA